jgi:hypothetical protein
MGRAMTMIRKLSLAGVMSLAALGVGFAAAPASAARLAAGSPQLVLKKYAIPQLNVRVHPRIPNICVNPLSKGPGAKKCG